MQKESVLFFSFPSESTFDTVRGTNKREQYKTKKRFLFLLSSESTFLRLAVARISVASAERDTVRGTNKRAKCKIYLSFFIDADVADVADVIF